MNGFGGLAHEHFAYVALLLDQRDSLVKDGMRRALEELGATVAGLIGTPWNVHVLNIKAEDSGAGVVIEPGKRASSPHLTIWIDPAGLNIHTNIELAEPFRKFRRVWESNPSGLIDLLRQLGEASIDRPSTLPWRLAISRRVPLGRPREFHYWRAVDIATQTFNSWPDEDVHRFVDAITQKPPGEAAPEILIVKSYPPAQAVATDHLPELLAHDVEQIRSFFDWIGEPLTGSR